MGGNGLHDLNRLPRKGIFSRLKQLLSFPGCDRFSLFPNTALPTQGRCVFTYVSSSAADFSFFFPPPVRHQTSAPIRFPRPLHPAALTSPHPPQRRPAGLQISSVSNSFVVCNFKMLLKLKKKKGSIIDYL